MKGEQTHLDHKPGPHKQTPNREVAPDYPPKEEY